MYKSLKQILRMPQKAILLFLTAIAVTVLVTIGLNLWIFTTNQMNTVESNFTTIATVEQLPISVEQNYYWDASVGDYVENKYFDVLYNVYGEAIPEDVLYFEDVSYINIERRPYYIAILPDFLALTTGGTRNVGTNYVFEFTVYEDSTTDNAILINTTNVLHGYWGTGDTYIWDMYTNGTTTLEVGKTYIAYSTIHTILSVDGAPDDGTFILSSVPWTRDEEIVNIEEVTENFYETEKGQAWLNLVEAIDLGLYSFPVLPTNSLDLLPSFQSDEVSIEYGREITDEEFETGANVCIVPTDFLTYHGLSIGDVVSIPLYTANYADSAHTYYFDNAFQTFNVLVSDDGEIFDVFWEAEYEIVGTYNRSNQYGYSPGTTEIADDMFIIPMNSVKVSDENNIIDYAHMLATTTSFEIANGTEEEFIELFNENVEESDLLELTFYDNGYNEIINTLEQSRLMSCILLAFGVVSALACIVMFVYFFIICEKKRTAVERSLGMTKNQCRVSLISGVLILFAIATVIGMFLGIYIFDNLEILYNATETFEFFSTDYSSWSRPTVQAIETQPQNINLSIILIPVLQILSLGIISLTMVNRSLKIQPILLLGKKD